MWKVNWKLKNESVSLYVMNKSEVAIQKMLNKNTGFPVLMFLKD